MRAGNAPSCTDPRRSRTPRPQPRQHNSTRHLHFLRSVFGVHVAVFPVAAFPVATSAVAASAVAASAVAALASCRDRFPCRTRSQNYLRWRRCCLFQASVYATHAPARTDRTSITFAGALANVRPRRAAGQPSLANICPRSAASQPSLANVTQFAKAPLRNLAPALSGATHPAHHRGAADHAAQLRSCQPQQPPAHSPASPALDISELAPRRADLETGRVRAHQCIPGSAPHPGTTLTVRNRELDAMRAPLAARLESPAPVHRALVAARPQVPIPVCRDARAARSTTPYSSRLLCAL